MKTGLTATVTSDAIGTFITVSQPMKENVTWTFQNLAFLVAVIAGLVTICYTIHKWRKEDKRDEYEDNERKTNKRRNVKRVTKTSSNDEDFL